MAGLMRSMMAGDDRDLLANLHPSESPPGRPS